MPFGIINSAPTLKRAMKKLIEDLDIKGSENVGADYLSRADE